MANQTHLEILQQGVEAWNLWRKRNHYSIEPDLSRASLTRAHLFSTNLSRANLSKAFLGAADLTGANLSGADLSEANLLEVRLNMADLSEANLSDAYLGHSVFVRTDLTGATLLGCRVYGISAWNLKLEGAKQQNLNVSDTGEPAVLVDNLEVAQFIHSVGHFVQVALWRFVCQHIESFPDIGRSPAPNHATRAVAQEDTGRAAPRFTAGSMQDTVFRRKEETMTDYLPEVYQHFERRYPAVKEAFDALGAAEHDAGPLAQRERRLIKLGIAVGAESEGGVRSHVRKLLGVGVSEEEILHTIVLALTTIGFPATNAALSWAEEVLSEEV